MFSSLFQTQFLVSASLVTFFMVVFFTLLLLPSILRAGTSVEQTAQAAYGYIIQTIGIFLMTMSGLPAFYAAIGSQAFSSGMYSALLAVFAVGGILFLWQDGAMRKIDYASRMLPHLIFFYVWKLIGVLAMLAAGLSAVFFLLTSTALPANGWWMSYLGLFAYGAIVSWLTFERPIRKSFSSAPMMMKPAMGAHVKKPIAKKPSKKKKK